MKLRLTVDLDIQGTTRTKLLEDLWEQFEEELDGRITDTYFLAGDYGDKEVAVNVDRVIVA
jgi:hypothetical protein